MIHPSRFLTVLLIFTTAQEVRAVDIVVGDTTLAIPAPEGFAPVTNQMQPLAEVIKRFVPETNAQFAYFIPEEVAPQASAGESPVFLRNFYVQTTKDLIPRFVTSQEFEQLKQGIKSQNQKILQEIETKIPGIMQKINQDVSQDFGADLDLTVGQIVPLPAHAEGDRQFSYSTYVTYSMNDETGAPTTFRNVVTATLVHIMGKVLFLYTVAEDSELTWGRTAASAWTERVIAANPSDEVTAARERIVHGGFNWDGMIRSGVIGAIVGGMAGAVGYFINRRKPKPPPTAN